VQGNELVVITANGERLTVLEKTLNMSVNNVKAKVLRVGSHEELVESIKSLVRQQDGGNLLKLTEALIELGTIVPGKNESADDTVVRNIERVLEVLKSGSFIRRKDGTYILKGAKIGAKYRKLQQVPTKRVKHSTAILSVLGRAPKTTRQLLKELRRRNVTSRKGRRLKVSSIAARLQDLQKSGKVRRVSTSKPYTYISVNQD
jgi:hypothetical protein